MTQDEKELLINILKPAIKMRQGMLNETNIELTRNMRLNDQIKKLENILRELEHDNIKTKNAA